MPRKTQTPLINPAQVESSEDSSTSATQESKKIDVLFFIDVSRDGINSQNVRSVENEIKNLNSDVLYLVLHTDGGDVYSAVRIIRLLQGKFTTINVIIPERAFSSGTIMTLGANQIYMDQDSMLGPLDLPIEHPVDGSVISSLDITNFLSNVTAICSSSGMKIFQQLRDGGANRLGKREAATIAFDTASQLLQPILSKIDPYVLQRGYREQDIGLFYAYELLTSRLMVNNHLQAQRTSITLVNNYPSHGYGIFRDEANRTLKLGVKELEKLEVWKKIQSQFESIKEKVYYIKSEIVSI